MELVDCTVRLGGSLLHTVRKYSVTVPEIVVLKALHGDDGVIDFKLLPRVSKRNNPEELARLYQLYEPDEKSVNKGLIKSLFPGHNPNLPRTLKEIDIDIATQHLPRQLKEAPDYRGADGSDEEEVSPPADPAEAAALMG